MSKTSETNTQSQEIVGAKRFSVSDLSNSTARVLGSLAQREIPGVVTYRGIPSFLIIPLTEQSIVSLIKDTVPSILDDDIRAAESALRVGEIFPSSNIET